MSVINCEKIVKGKEFTREQNPDQWSDMKCNYMPHGMYISEEQFVHSGVSWCINENISLTLKNL